MTATISWLEPERIVYAKLEGNLLKEELDPLNQTVAQYVHEGHAPVHFIVDALGLEKFPMDLKQFSSTRVYLREPNMGKLAIISKQSMFVRFFASVITQAAHIEMKIFDSLDEALSFLERVDGSLKLHKTA
jgi:hypothetical protein